MTSRTRSQGGARGGRSLAWSAQRVRDSAPGGLLNLWYAGFAGFGLCLGAIGELWNLGFLAETERQSSSHLQGHIDRLGVATPRTRAVIENMQREEAGHRRTAEALGARELPEPARLGMRFRRTLDDNVSYWI